MFIILTKNNIFYSAPHDFIHVLKIRIFWKLQSGNAESLHFKWIPPLFKTILNSLLSSFYIRELSCINMTYSGSTVLEKTPTPFLNFCNYLPFEEDLALYLNNLEFPLPKDNLYHVWLKLARWFWRRRFFFNINICKYGFPYCCPSRLPGAMMWTILNLHYIRKLSCKYYLFWLSSSGEEDF
jgi:hypothetical protein